MKTDKGILSTYRIVLVLGVWSLVMTSCGNENKSISEPLSLDERNELIMNTVWSSPCLTHWKNVIPH